MKHLINEVLKWAESTLNTAHIYTAVLDAEVLLAFVLNQDRAWLYAHSEISLSKRQWKKFQKLIRRRQKHEPLAYLTGHQEFYGLDFVVNKNVLIPRPETELMIDYLKDGVSADVRPLIVDVGAGSGCLAITTAKLWPRMKVLAIDNSPAALKVAKANAADRGVKKQIKFLKNDLLKGLKFNNKNLIFLANLPYLSISAWRQTQPEVRRYEPRAALVGGADGLKYYKKLIKQIAYLRPRRLTALLEIDPSQVKPLKKIIKKTLSGASIEIKKDLSELDRLIIIRTK